MRVSRAGGKASVGQDSPRYAENTGNKGRQGLSHRWCCGSAAALVGPQLASAKQNPFLCQCKQRCHTTVLASSAFGHVWWVAGARWLWLQASFGRGLWGCVSLIPRLPSRRVCLLGHSAALTLLPITYRRTDSYPESFDHRTDKCYLHCRSQAGLLGFPQSSAAHLYLAYLRGDLNENPGGKFVPLVTLRKTVLLYL